MSFLWASIGSKYQDLLLSILLARNRPFLYFSYYICNTLLSFHLLYLVNWYFLKCSFRSSDFINIREVSVATEPSLKRAIAWSKKILKTCLGKPIFVRGIEPATTGTDSRNAWYSGGRNVQEFCGTWRNTNEINVICVYVHLLCMK